MRLNAVLGSLSSARRGRERVLTRRRVGALVGAAGLVGGICAVGVASASAEPGSNTPGPTPPSHYATLYVSPSGSASYRDSSCSTAGYTSVQAAVNAANPGDTVYVCAGTYAEQVVVSTSNLNITGAGSSSVIQPTSASPASVTDPDNPSNPVVPIVDVTPGTVGLSLSDLVVDGSGLSGSFSGCGTDFAGILFQRASGAVSDVTVRNVSLPADLFGCQDGIGIYVEMGGRGSANVSLSNDTVTGYDKAGIVCNDAGTSCDVEGATVTGAGPSSTAQNGVQIAFGASGSVTESRISGNDYSGVTNSVEPQADYAAGVLVYGAAGNTDVAGNALADDQIGAEIIDSNASVDQNRITETGAGIAGSVGVFAVPYDYYSSDFNLTPGRVSDDVSSNQISFPGDPASSYGIWAGDEAASSSGSVDLSATENIISGAENSIVLGPQAWGNVSAPPPPNN